MARGKRDDVVRSKNKEEDVATSDGEANPSPPPPCKKIEK